MRAGIECWRIEVRSEKDAEAKLVKHDEMISNRGFIMLTAETILLTEIHKHYGDDFGVIKIDLFGGWVHKPGPPISDMMPYQSQKDALIDGTDEWFARVNWREVELK